MKIKEVTNPEEQLGLLRVIIDNTWSAIKQQADAHANQRVAQQSNKPKLKTSKRVPHAPKPKPLPKPKALYPTKTQPNKSPQMTSAIGKAMYKLPQAGTIGAPKQLPTGSANNSNGSLTNLEKDEVMNLPRGALPKPLY